MTGYANNTNDPAMALRLMRALDRASAKLEAVERATREPIAIVGVGCRFPGGVDSPEAFWRRLADGFDAIGEIPPDRWDVERFYDPDPDAAGKIYTRQGGFLERIDGLDARFFEIAPREAASMDPQQRLFLEVCWEALEHAGLPAEPLRCRRVGVYVGATTNDYGNLLVRSAGWQKIDAWFGTGNALNSLAGRIAHTLGLQGPAMAIDTACSSSLVAVHLACQGLRAGECELALVGGVNLILSPETMIATCRAKMLARDGRCKTFDATADGYARGEGCGVVVLKRLSDAVEHGDMVLAVIRGSAVNQDGPSSGFTVPNGPAQQALIRQALAAADVAPTDIDYLEAHGTGTPLGDPIEVQAAAAVLGQNRRADRPLIVGSVKTNIGHLESAAGIAGLIKTVLALAHGQIPPHLHLQTPNPHIPWPRLPVVVATALTAWPKTDHPRRAGLSSFGASGTNAHVVVEQAPAAAVMPPFTGDERPLHVLALSAKTPLALRELAERYAELLVCDALPFADICFSANTGRSHFAHRLAVVAASPAEARGELQQFVLGNSSPNAIHGSVQSEPPSAGLVSRENQPWDAWLRRLGELYVRGADVDWQGFDRDYRRRRVSLPTYPWQRQRYWFEPAIRPAESAAAESADDTATLRALRQCDVTVLADRLAQSGSFSHEEQTLLPKLLQAVAQQHHDDQAAAATDKWLYQVCWRRQVRGGRQPLPEYLPEPNEVCRQLIAEAERLTSSGYFQDYWQAIAEIEQLSIDYVAAALLRMGVDRQAARRNSAAELAERLQVDRRHQRLFEYLLKILADSSPPGGNGGHAANALSASNGDPGEWYRRLLAEHPSARAELTLLDRCGSQLDEVLRGRCDPLPLLFPENSDDTAGQLYENSPGARLMNALVQRTLAAAAAQLPASRTLRVLEIGAGTGGTTSAILPALPGDRCDYVFTDISPRFTTAARVKFQERKFIQYRLLDIERTAESQGFAPGQFDIVIAANILHATRDVGQSVRHARQLLAPGGLLVLLEATRPMRFLDCIFGLTEGWWRFADRELRPSHPLLSAVAWKRLLLDSGFREAAACAAADGEDGILAQQAVVIARTADEEPSHEVRCGADHWVILADRTGVGPRLASLVAAPSAAVTQVYAAEQFQQIAPNVFAIVPERMDDLRRIMAQRVGSGHRVDIVHLWSLDSPHGDIDAASTLGCRSVLNLTQMLMDAASTQDTRLCVVTRRAAAVVDGDGVAGLTQAPLWGMARVIAAELPELAPRRIDLGSQDADASARFLCEELQWGDGEDEVAFRLGGRYVPRLLRTDAQSLRRDQANHRAADKVRVPSPIPGGGAQGAENLRADATYLITGGMGGLGSLIARSMVQRGARHLVLVGRREPSERAAAQLDDIERMGARIVVCQADVSLRQDVSRVLAQVADSMPPLRGVVHAAGVLDDGVLRQLSWERFDRVLAPKVNGAWHLHQLTAGMGLDVFMLFSSMASLWGSPGQANHAAANAFLDGLAWYRRARNLPALSINWGAWSEVGAAARHDVSQHVKRRGIGTIAPEHGLAVLDRLWSAPAAQVAVVPIDWTQQADLPPLFAEMAAIDESPSQVGEEEISRLKDRLLAALPHRRRALLLDHVRSSVAQVLGLSANEISAADGLMQLGMDSLTSIELRNRLQRQLQCSLPSTLAFDYPTSQRLADYLHDRIANGDDERSYESRFTAAHNGADSLDDLSEEELAALLEQELKAVAE